jgi:hypothetical protein
MEEERREKRGEARKKWKKLKKNKEEGWMDGCM